MPSQETDEYRVRVNLKAEPFEIEPDAETVIRKSDLEKARQRSLRR